MARGEHDKAREYSEKLLRLRPNAQAGLAGMICGCHGARRLQIGGPARRAIGEEPLPDSFEAWFNLGVAYQKTNRLEQAGQAYAEAMKLKPDSALAYANLGADASRNAAICPKRARLTNARCNLRPRTPPRYGTWPSCRSGWAIPSEAEKCIEKLVEVDPEREEAWFRVGYLRLLRGDCGGQYRAVPGVRQQAVRLAGGAGEPGRGAAPRRGTGSARRHPSPRPRRVIPSRCDALRGLAAVAIEHGRLRAGAGYWRPGCEQLGERIPELNYNIGILLQQSNLARKTPPGSYRRATEEKPEFAEALLNLGHALEALGQEEEARGCWQQAVQAEAGAGGKIFLVSWRTRLRRDTGSDSATSLCSHFTLAGVCCSHCMVSVTPETSSAQALDCALRSA